MRKLLLLVVAAVLGCSWSFAENRSWDFTSWSETTLTNLLADTTTNWKASSATRYENKVTMSGTIQANGIDIAELSGLTFGSCGSGKLRIDYDTSPDRLMLNGGKLTITIPSCLAGDTLKVITKTASNSTARGITVTAGTLTRLNADETSTEVLENVFYVDADGDVTVSTTGGLHFRKISVTATAAAEPEPEPEPGISYIVNESFVSDATLLPEGWAQVGYTKFFGTALNGASSTAAVNVENSNLTFTGSGGGDRGVAVTLPSSGDADRISLSFDWHSGNPGSEANKMVDLVLQDADANPFLYFYAENWNGAKNHFHCANLDLSFIPGGANRDVPAVAIAANQSTLVGGADTALVVNDYVYTISATVNFASKKIEVLTIAADGKEFTYTNLPFVSASANNFARISAATYRNAAGNSDGTGTSGNGSSAYLAFTIDNVKVWENQVSNPALDAGYLVQTDTLAGAGFPVHSDYFYTIDGFQKEYLNNNRSYSYAAGGITAQSTVPSTDLAYLWDITYSETDGEYYIRSVAEDAYMSSFDGDEYSGITLASTPVSLKFDFIPNTTVGQKGSEVVQKDCGNAYAEYAAFRVYSETLSRILIRGGTMWRKGQLTQTRCDFLTFFSAYPKKEAYQSIFPKELAEAKAMAACTITEGTEAWNYAVGLKAELEAAIKIAEETDTTSWARMEFALNILKVAKNAFKEAFVLPAAKYTMEVAAGYVSGETFAGLTFDADVNKALVFDMEKTTDNKVTFYTAGQYLGLTDFSVEPVAFAPVVDNGKVLFLLGADTLKINGEYWFTVAEYKGEVLALVKKWIGAENNSTTADTSNIMIVFDQKVQLLDAALITLNGKAADVEVVNDTLFFKDKLECKTRYDIIVAKGALANASNAALVLDSIVCSFRTFSPYLRDGQSMITDSFNDKVYALFGQGSSNGYMNAGNQLSVNAEGALYCGLNGLNTSMWRLVLNSEKRAWTVQNYANGKYAAYNEEDATLFLSDEPCFWQISLNTAATGNTDWQNVYTFWPLVDDTNPLYDYAMKVTTLKIEKFVSGDASFHVCPMESLTRPDIHARDTYMTIGARNTGYVWIQSGDEILFGENPGTAAAHWLVLRDADGRYSFQNRATGDYATYVNDSTVKALPYNAEMDQSWTIMFHCEKSPAVYHTIQGASLAITTDYAAANCTGKVGLSARNGGNAASTQGLARAYFSDTKIPFIGDYPAPVVTVPASTQSNIFLNWTAVKFADKYQISYGFESATDLDSTGTRVFVDSLATIVTLGADTLEYIIEGLQENDQVYYQVLAISENGYFGNKSELASAATVAFSSFAPPAPICDSVAMKSVFVSWGASVLADKYVLTYSLNSDMSEAVVVDDLAVLNYEIPNLPANTKVYFTLTLKNDQGDKSQASSIASAVSGPYTLLVPQEPVVESVTSTSFNLTWSAAIDAVAYNVRYHRSSAGVANAEPIRVEGTSYVLEGLNANTTYYVSIQAINTAGELSSQSKAVRGKTDVANAIDAAKAGLQVYSQQGVLFIQSDKAVNVSVYNLAGVQVCRLEAQAGLTQVDDLTSGHIYLVRCGAEVHKIAL